MYANIQIPTDGSALAGKAVKPVSLWPNGSAPKLPC